MYFDDYSTSFQSLYKPMYNLQPGNATINANMAGVGAGAGMIGGQAMGMGGYTPMAQVGIGQFGPDQLIRNNEQKNNYYARPIAAHKVKDETPTILGIIGTALGTAALLLALRKGKKVKPNPVPPNPGPTPPATTGVMGNNFAKAPNKAKSFKIDPNSIRYAGGKKGPKPGPQPPVVTQSGNLPTVAPKYINPNTKGADYLDRIASPAAIQGGLTRPYTPVQPGPNPPIANSAVMGNNFAPAPYKAKSFEIDPNSIKYAPTGKGKPPVIKTNGDLPNVAPKYINPNTKGANYLDRIASPDAIKGGLTRPYSPVQGNTPQNTAEAPIGLLTGNTNTPAGLLGASPINIPATIQGNGSNIVKVPNEITIAGVPTKKQVSFTQELKQRAVDTPFEEIATTALPYNTQKALSGMQQNMPVLVQQPNLKPLNEFLPKAEQNFVIQNGNIKGYLPTQQESILTKVNNNLGTIRNDLKQNGSIVRTTHTLESFANGYSIGANAKGADKLAALRAQLAQA